MSYRTSGALAASLCEAWDCALLAQSTLTSPRGRRLHLRSEAARRRPARAIWLGHRRQQLACQPL